MAFQTDVPTDSHESNEPDHAGSSRPIWVLQIVMHDQANFIGTRIVLTPRTVVPIGRNTVVSAISTEPVVFQDAKVSVEHVQFVVEENTLEATVLSKNGITVGKDKRIRGDVVQLVDGNVLSIATSRNPIMFVVRRTVRAEFVSAPTQIVGESAEIMRLKQLIRTLAPLDAPILIYGPTGTGKELVAESLHEASRARNPLVRVNCAELHENSLVSELFGHKKGAFTGAIADRDGLIVTARDGTLFLDEIHHMSKRVQAMLLRFLDTKTIRPLGGNTFREVNVRVVCASNADFDKLIRTEAFLPDLYHRLTGSSLRLPSLAERKDDIPSLAYHFLRRNQLGQNCRIHHRLMLALLMHAWPGNVRELKNTITMAVAHGSDGDAIALSAEIEDLLAQSRAIFGASDTNLTISTSPSSVSTNQAPMGPSKTNTELPSPEAIRDEFAKHGGNIRKTASELGVERQTLYRLFKKWGIDYRKFRNS